MPKGEPLKGDMKMANEYEFSVGKIELSEENKKWYNRKGYTMTGETLTQRCLVGFKEEITYVVFKGKYTRYGTCRDCGDHYIIAWYSQFVRVDKGTLLVTYYSEDE